MSKDDNDALAAALKEQRENGDKHFVFLRDDRRQIPGIRAALEKEAQSSGRLLVGGTPDGAMVQHMRDFQDRPAMSRNDGSGFLDNLNKIAAGRLRVS